MEYRQLGEIQISRMAFGTWHLSGDWGEVDENQAVVGIRKARQLGINVFDTAQAYGFGLAEKILGRVLFEQLREHRDDVVIASKGGIRRAGCGMVRDSSRSWLRQGLESSLKALGIDTIDIYQVHWPDKNIPMAEVAGTMKEFVDEGKVRYIGLSNFSASQLSEFSKTIVPLTLQVPYNFIKRDIEHDLLPLATRQGIGVLTYSPLAHGILSGSVRTSSEYPEDDWRNTHPLFQGDTLARQLEAVEALRVLANRHDTTIARLAYGWVLSKSNVDSVIMGTLRERHLIEATDAERVRLSDQLLHELDVVYRKWAAPSVPTDQDMRNS